MPSRGGVTLLEVLDTSAIVVWENSRSALRAADFLLRFVACESGVTPPARICMQVTDWFYTPFCNDVLRASTAEEFLEHCVFELRSWRYNPFRVTVDGSTRTWFMIAFDVDGVEFGPIEKTPGFSERVIAAFNE
ncbi:MAG TPA: hypothetical protein VEK11_19425 [Thermoanaerobaculia bacterium]|jgi:hypothetical protein|nr:hypothetical protein [Thermoanaerobaculia bacterium]